MIIHPIRIVFFATSILYVGFPYNAIVIEDY